MRVFGKEYKTVPSQHLTSHHVCVRLVYTQKAFLFKIIVAINADSVSWNKGILSTKRTMALLLVQIAGF